MKRKLASKRLVFLRGERVILRPLCVETDLEIATRWINDPDIRQYVLAHLPMSRESEKEWLERAAKGGGTDIILAIEMLDGKLIGTIGLHRINWKDGTATTGTIIGDEADRGLGYATEAKMLILEYAFNELGLRKICSGALAFNDRSFNYSLRCGYQIEGRLRRQFLKRGTYCDEVILGVFRDEWLAARERWRAEQKDRNGKNAKRPQ